MNAADNVKAVYVIAFEKCLDFMSLNAVKCNCSSIFIRYLQSACFCNKIRVTKMIHKYDEDNIVNWESYTCSVSNLSYACPTQSTQSVRKVGYLRKRSHNRLSPGLCTKVKNPCRHS